ncbi:dicarboxylate/amino acid:cation symporter [Candidatus Margulisiibacteriota bacterium]
MPKLGFKLKIHTQILIAMVLGMAVGFFFQDFSLVFFPKIGEVFIRALRMLIVPIVTVTMVLGMASVGNIRKIGSIGLKTFVYFIGSTLLACIIGLILVNLTSPGVGTQIIPQNTEQFLPQQSVTLVDTLVAMVPKNIFESFAKADMLPIILFSLLLGAALTTIGDKAKPFLDILNTIDNALMQIIDWIIKLAPYGVFALMATMVAKSGFAIFKPMIVYIFTVILGLFIHSIFILPMLLKSFSGYSPLKLFKQMMTAILTSFSVCSSAAALPITMDLLIKKVKVSKRITGFLIPLGTTINMNGTALYLCVVSVFIAQVYGIKLLLSHLVIIAITATLAAIGAAAIPSASIFTLVLILQAINVPVEGIGLIIAVDRIVDMFRSGVNLWGNACGAVIVAKLEGESFSE